MVRFIHSIPIAIRLWAIVGLMVVGFGINFAVEMRNLSIDTYAARQAKVRSVVEAAHGMLSHYAKQAEQGILTREQAEAAAKAAILAMRYDGKEYLWLNTLDGVMAAHPNPDLVGKPLFALTDAKGNTFFKEMVDIARSKGEGELTYYWVKPGGTEPLRKISYVKAFTPWNMLVGSGIYVDDVEAAIRERAVEAGVFALAGILLLAGVSFVIARSITRPLGRLTGAMHKLAEGELETEIPDRDKGAEIGAMVQAVQVFKDNALAVRRMEAERAEAEARTAAERRAMLMNLAENFEASVKRVVDKVGQSAGAVHSAAATMTGTAEQASERSSAVAAAAEQASANVQTVAVATEQLSASIDEISRQVHRSADIAQDAFATAGRTDQIMRGLSESAAHIGQAVGLINDIANQTNMLALNATIEAARAGEAGKGFAVVAGEVKGLATQTAKATQEISAQVSGVQQATTQAVEALAEIGHVIGELNEIAGSIAAAIEQQGAATRDISRNTQEAAQGTQHVSDNVEGVRSAAGEAGRTAGDLLGQAQELTGEAQALSEAVDGFLSGIRAA